ncbi:MAG: ribbon-helix-helix protein, CopG family [Planctomycetaceae bacterium]
MGRRQVLVQLDDAQVQALDRLLPLAEGSRSELIRRAVDLYVRALDEAVADVRYAEAYRALPEVLEDDAALRSLALRAWPER